MRLREAIAFGEFFEGELSSTGANSGDADAVRVLLAAARKWAKARRLLKLAPVYGMTLIDQNCSAYVWKSKVDELLKGRP